ncbi:MAG: GTP cyclohydrolase II [Spirochaetaceae bacterium]|nr:GTP cyclohydrolase II [Spirochaetaceae bacterium]
MLDRESLTADCANCADRAELESKLAGKPDYRIEERYCRGKGAYCKDEDFCVELVAHAKLPTRFGDFELYGFYDAREDKEHTALVRGEVRGATGLPVRVHSECHTGDVLGSLRCDCRNQLEAALRHVGALDAGAVLYLKQEGRGIGLLNKIKAYRLQELGLDTAEANRYLGFPEEARDYKVAAKMLRLLGIESIALLTNNPDKIDKLRAEGIVITGRLPLVIPPNPHDEAYLATKKEKMGHLFQ